MTEMARFRRTRSSATASRTEAQNRFGFSLCHLRGNWPRAEVQVKNSQEVSNNRRPLPAGVEGLMISSRQELLMVAGVQDAAGLFRVISLLYLGCNGMQVPLLRRIHGDHQLRINMPH